MASIINKAREWDRRERERDIRDQQLQATTSTKNKIGIIERRRDYPTWSTIIDKQEFNEYKDEIKVKIDNLEKSISNLEKTVAILQKSNFKLEREVTSYRYLLMSKSKKNDFWAISDRNVNTLEMIFNLNEVIIEHPENALSELKGILKDFKKDGLNSDEIIRSIREE